MNSSLHYAPFRMMVFRATLYCKRGLTFVRVKAQKGDLVNEAGNVVAV